MNKRMLKAQSAMEYLMTYGWAILIIAVVLGALFSLGVFTPGIGLGNSCIAFSGYLCSGMTYLHAAGAGTLTLTIGQSTGTNWGNTIILFAMQGTATGSPGPAVTGTATVLPWNTINGGLTSGQTATITLSSNSVTTAQTATIGTTVAGALWACYLTSAATLTYASGTGTCTAGSGTVYYAQIATLTAKAV